MRITHTSGKRKLWASAFLLLFALTPLAFPYRGTAENLKITVYTFEIPPYTLNENGRLTGAAVEIIESVFKRAQIPCSVKLLPFSRAYQTTQTTPNSFVFPITRVSDRENDFQWAGAITPSPMSAYVLSSRTDIRILTLDDMRKWKIGTIQKDVRENYLLKHNFDISSMQRLSGSQTYERNIRKLAMKRIDILPFPDHVFLYLSAKDGYKPTTFRKAYTFDELSSLGYSLAAHPGIDKDIISKIRNELIRFKGTQEYNAILKKWNIPNH